MRAMSLVTELRGAILGKGYRLGPRLGADDPGHTERQTYEATHERLPSCGKS